MITEKVLRAAVNGIEYCEKGGILDEYIDIQFNNENTKEFRKIISSVLFLYFRNKSAIDYVIGCLAKSNARPFIRRIISVALIQINFQDGIPNEIAVDVAVTFVKKHNDKRAAGYVNAILRNSIRQSFFKIIEDAPAYIKTGIPKILLKKWNRNFLQKEVEQICESIQQQAPLTFRIIEPIEEEKLEEINCTQITGLDFLDSFKFYSTENPGSLLEQSWLNDGKIYVQDPATVMATGLIKSDFQGEILDLCSAPGGKTLILSELFPKSNITAMDRSAKRLIRVRENIAKTKRDNIYPIVADALELPFKNKTFNLVFADVPCSNTGVFRRRPDAIWRFTNEELREVVELQRQILQSASQIVSSGGYFVYSTCSIEPDEDRKQIDNFLEKNTNFSLIEDKLLLPSKIHDGAYAAILIKK